MALALAVRHVLQTSSSQQVVMSAAPLVTPMQVIRVVLMDLAMARIHQRVHATLAMRAQL